MKLEIKRFKEKGVVTYNYFINGELKNSFDTLTKLLTNCDKYSDRGLLSYRQSARFYVGNECKEILIPEPVNDAGFKLWVDAVLEIRKWADTIINNNEQLTFTHEFNN